VINFKVCTFQCGICTYNNLTLDILPAHHIIHVSEWTRSRFKLANVLFSRLGLEGSEFRFPCKRTFRHGFSKITPCILNVCHILFRGIVEIGNARFWPKVDIYSSFSQGIRKLFRIWSEVRRPTVTNHEGSEIRFEGVDLLDGCDRGLILVLMGLRVGKLRK